MIRSVGQERRRPSRWFPRASAQKPIRLALGTRKEDPAGVLEILHRHGSIDYAMDTACAYAEAARLTIAELPDSEAKRALLWVPGFVTTRDR